MRNFKKAILTTTVAVLTGAMAFSQSCELSVKDGGKLTLVVQTWTNPLLADSKFLKAKDDKKDEQITTLNADIRSGKIAPASNSSSIYSIKKGAVNGWDEYTMTISFAGVDYSGYLFCNKDTLYQYRNRGMVRIGTPESPVGEIFQGVQKLPAKMKIGDVLTPFQDYSFIYPQTMDATVKHKISDGFRLNTVDKYGPYVDSHTGVSGDGPYRETSLKEVFKNVDVALKQKFSFTGHTINYVHAIVKAEEQVTISGVNYKAFVIESETWNNAKMAAAYESASEKYTLAELSKEIAKEDKKAEKKMQRQALKIGYVNELGYNVTYKQEWFVPQIGIVKTVAFDTYGGISTIMTTTELK